MNLPASTHALRPARILETSLYAENLEAAEVFYQAALGLELVGKEPGRHLFFKCHNQMLLVFNPAKTREKSETAPHGARGPGHVAFASPMSDLDEWKRRLTGMEVEIEQDVRWSGGGRSFYFRDPAGNCLEFASPFIWGMPDDWAKSRIQ